MDSNRRAGSTTAISQVVTWPSSMTRRMSPWPSTRAMWSTEISVAAMRLLLPLRGAYRHGVEHLQGVVEARDLKAALSHNNKDKGLPAY